MKCEGFGPIGTPVIEWKRSVTDEQMDRRMGQQTVCHPDMRET